MPDENIVRPRPKETENEIDERGAFVRQRNHLKALFGNIHSLLPKGPDLSVWNKPHGRDRF